MLLSVYADVIAPEDAHVAVEEVCPPGGEGPLLYSILLLMGDSSVPVFRLDGLSRRVLAGLAEQSRLALGEATTTVPDRG